MSLDPEDFKPIARQCQACGATFWVSATVPKWQEPDVCRACDEEYEAEPGEGAR